jgi:ankyrin repeat protein
VDNSQHLDALFREAVSAIDAGDVTTLERFLVAHPNLVHERLESPGSWLRDQVGGALDTFFKRPYLLWFVAEDPIRNGTLPANIAAVAQSLIRAAKRAAVPNLQEQLDYALTLVAWSTIARKCGVQIDLIDTLIDAGANPDGNPNNALVNGNVAAAEHLVERGAKLTLAAALCLGRWEEAAQLAPTTTDRQKQFALVLAALNGQADALRRMIAMNVDVNATSEDLYSHGTPLHHAVCSGSLDAVRALVEAGANLNAKDTAWQGTPLGWAEHYVGEAAANEQGKMHREIAAYLSAWKKP